jgi:hypothetical protein
MEPQLAVYALVLRELVHRALGRVATEPWLHDKRALAQHAHDDAQLVAAILRRLGTTAPAVSVLGEHDAYASVKPGLAVAVRDHLAEIDAVAAPDDARLLSDIATRQELHVAELPARIAAPPFVLDEGAGEPLAVVAAPSYPARDPFVEPGRATDGLHGRLNAAILAGEVAAQTAHEQPDQPWRFHADLARLAADRLEATAELDRALTASGLHWGDEPVDLAAFGVALRLDLPGRLRFAADPEDAAHHEIVLRWS